MERLIGNKKDLYNERTGSGKCHHKLTSNRRAGLIRLREPNRSRRAIEHEVRRCLVVRAREIYDKTADVAEARGKLDLHLDLNTGGQGGDVHDGRIESIIRYHYHSR